MNELPPAEAPSNSNNDHEKCFDMIKQLGIVPIDLEGALERMAEQLGDELDDIIAMNRHVTKDLNDQQ